LALNIEQKPEKFSPFHCSINSNIFSSIIINFIGNPIFIRHKTFLFYWPTRETIRLVTGAKKKVGKLLEKIVLKRKP
jgi:hypothetical protein